MTNTQSLPASKMLLRAGIALGIILLLLVVGRFAFADGSEPASQDERPVVESRTEVQWADYDGSVQERIDGLEAAKDCVGLQSEFDVAESNSTVMLNRTGHGNALLMGYIDEALRLAGCY